MFRNALCGHAPVNETRDDNIKQPALDTSKTTKSIQLWN